MAQSSSKLQHRKLIAKCVVFDRDFDAVGNRTKLEANFGGTLSGTSISGGVYDFSNSYAYDAMHRLTSVTQTSRSGANAVAPKLATFSYNAASQLTDVQRYSATTPSTPTLEVHSRWGYDSAGRLSSITHGKTEITAGQYWDGSSTAPASLGASNTLAAYFFDYDQANRLNSFSSYKDVFKTSYSYDNRDQLTAASSAAISGLTPPFSIPTAESYNLDDHGNRKSSGGASQSASGTHNRLQTDGTYNYEYDAEGNTTKRTVIATGEVTDYTWDHRNRLVSVTERVSASGAATQKVEFIYDAFDQRVGKRVDTDGDRTWDRYEAYVWADGHEMLRLVDSDGPGSAESFEVASRYLYADAVDQVLADEQYGGNGPAVSSGTASAQAGETLWTLGDHLGSVRDAVDNNGVIRQHVVYDSFGNRVREADYNSSGTQIAKAHADAIDILFGYTGRDWDEDIGLQYNRARWYDPATGRWLSQDPIGFAAGDANLYRYVGNGSTNATDPSGLETILLPLPHRPTNRERFNELYPDQVKYGYSDEFVDIMVHAYDANVEAARRDEYFRRESIKFNKQMLVDASFTAPLVVAGVYAGPAALSAAGHLGRCGYVYAMQHGASAGGLAVELANPAPVSIVGGGLAIAKLAPRGVVSRTGAESVNAGAALRSKLSALETAQQTAARIRNLSDGRIHYYRAETAARTPGSTRGASLVTECNRKTGQVRQWMESYDHAGNVVRVHPKMIDGQQVISPHFPPTGRELGQ